MTSDNPYSASGDEPGQRPSFARYEVLGMLAMAATIAYLSRSSFGVAETTIRNDLDLEIRQTGWVMSAFFWSYAVLQVPSGWFTQRIGTRWALTLFALTGAAAALGVGLAPALWALIVAYLLMGAAQAGLFPSAVYSISHWMPQARRSFACGILSVGMQIGAIMAAFVTGALIEEIGWRRAFMIYSVPGFLLAMLFLSRFRNSPAQDRTVNAAELALIQSGRDSAPTREKSPTPWEAILISPTVWFLCLQQVFRAAGYMFFASWFPTFLQESREMSVSESGKWQAVVFAGTLIGSVCGGMLSDTIWRRTGNLKLSRSGVGACCLLICALLLLSAWFVEDAELAVALLTGGAFFAALAGPSAYVVTIDIAGDHVPQVFGLMNMMGNFGAAACPILVAELFARTDNWNIVLLMFAGLYLTGAVCWLLVDPGRKVTPTSPTPST